jgi:hypothetical protein
MTLRPGFDLGHSEYNPFLFAVVGEEELGLPLTVLTALTRLGIDPWEEAARLSDLPRDVAARALAATIATLPRRDDKAADPQAVAARLVDRLPPHSVPPVPAFPTMPNERREASGIEPEKAKSRFAIALPWAVLALAALFFFLYLHADNNLEPAIPADAPIGRSNP